MRSEHYQQTTKLVFERNDFEHNVLNGMAMDATTQYGHLAFRAR